MNKSSFIQTIIPYDIHDPKVRLGPSEDGGYVASITTIDNSSALFTYGVGHDIRFEEDYVRVYDKPVYLYDHTIGRTTGWDLGKNLNFYNEGLGFVENCNDFLVHHRELNLVGDVLLKIDIEGNEYNYFETVDIKKLSKITSGILLELHWLSNDEYRQRAENILSHINNFYTLTHIHGNAWGVTFEHSGYNIPDTLELSFVNNRYVLHKDIDMQKYPIEGLDFSNRPGYPDIDLPFTNTLV